MKDSFKIRIKITLKNSRSICDKLLHIDHTQNQLDKNQKTEFQRKKTLK